MRLIFLFTIFAFAGIALADEAELAEKPRFDVMEYQVGGNTVLPVIAVEEAVYPYLGEKKTVDDVDHARENLERAYHDAGYLTVLVDIPEQKVDSGIVHLKVTEGTVSKVRVTGSRYFSQGRILAKTPSVAEGSVPYFPDVQTEINSVNTSADRRVTPILKPGKAPGTVEVDLKVEDRLPFHASVELNNRHSANTTPWRVSGMLRYDNLWQREHSLSVQYQTAPENPEEVKVLSGTYVIPLSASGDALALYAVRSRSNVAAATSLGDSYTVQGNGDIYGVRRIVPLPARGQYFHSMTLGADYKDFKEDFTLKGTDTQKSPISYLPLLVSYSGTDQGEKSLTQFNLSGNFAFRGLGNRTEDFENKRYKAQANYIYFRGDIEHTHTVFEKLSLNAKLGGQWAGMPLISNEQYSVGGMDTVRGYLESEAVGDDALRASLELSGPALTGTLPASIAALRWLIFTEGAVLRVKDALPSQQSRFTLSSAGFGIRFKAWQKLNASLDMGWPFKNTLNTQANSPRLHFKMAYEF